MGRTGMLGQRSEEGRGGRANGRRSSSREPASRLRLRFPSSRCPAALSTFCAARTNRLEQAGAKGMAKRVPMRPLGWDLGVFAWCCKFRKVIQARVKWDGGIPMERARLIDVIGPDWKAKTRWVREVGGRWYYGPKTGGTDQRPSRRRVGRRRSAGLWEDLITWSLALRFV